MSYSVGPDTYQRPASVSDVQVSWSISANVLYNIAIITLSIIAIGTSTAAYLNSQNSGASGLYLFLLIAVSIFLAIFIIGITYKGIQKSINTKKTTYTVVEKQI
jgi:hypothetical protein